MQIVIRPMDVWLFRDGRPFTAGEDHLADSVFPPSPFTLQGAIRTKVLVDAGVDLVEFAQGGSPHAAVGYGDNVGTFRLRGPLLAYRQEDGWERLIPLPADVVKAGQDYKLLRPKGDLPFLTDLPKDVELLWVQTGERPGEARGWLPEGQWEGYLRGHAPDRAQVLTWGHLVAFESRFGITMDREKGTAQEAMLYQVRLARLRDQAALWAEVDGVQMRSEGILRFGGEGRAAEYQALKKPLPPLSQFHALDDARRFKVVLLTPAWFSDGWQPPGGDWQQIFGTPVRLVGVALPRPLLLGGFDVARSLPKPMRAFVPPGAVYFFESKERLSLPDEFAFTETPDAVRKQNDDRNAWAWIGMGVVLIGIW